MSVIGDEDVKLDNLSLNFEQHCFSMLHTLKGMSLRRHKIKKIYSGFLRIT